MLDRGFTITWIEQPPPPSKTASDGADEKDEPDDQTGSESGKRVKYTCPICRLNAWAKHSIQLVCGADMRAMEPAP